MLDVKRIKVFREVATLRLVLRRGRVAVVHPVGGQPAGGGAGARDRHPAAGPHARAACAPPSPGRALLAHADAILARLECAEDELAELAGLRGGRLRLAGFQSAGATLLPRAVAAFHERHPKVELGMVEAEPAEAVERLRSGDIDMALVYDFEPLPGSLGPDLELTHLLDDTYDAVLAARATRWPSAGG